MSNQFEKVAREKRVIDACKNNLMGQVGKLGIILKVYGQPIMKEGTGIFDATYLPGFDQDDVYTEYSPTFSGGGPVAYRDEIRTSDAEHIELYGMMFDGLPWGMHLEIRHMINENQLKVFHQGRLVYQETAGELDVYNSTTDWEEMVNRVYAKARPKMKIIKVEEAAEKEKETEQRRQSFFGYLKEKWGL